MEQDSAWHTTGDAAARIWPQNQHHHAPLSDDSVLLPPVPSRPPPPYQVRHTRSTPTLSPAVESPASRRLKTALEEAQFLASGLVSRPAESTKHYTIIRHSHGLVWYKGPETSIVISILADEPVPAGRSVFLQEKGYSGNMGMSLKALGGPRDSWIDVTPSIEAQAQHIAAMDERAIQRDLGRFADRVSGRLKGHVPRETYLVRIPASACDGYFRLVLCDGRRRILCGSPVFRIASTSSDVSVIRGASPSTMPLEMGIRIASTVGTQVVKKYMGIAGALAQSNTAGKIAAKGCAMLAASSLGDAVQEGWRQGNNTVSLSAEGAGGVAAPDSGPVAPFPIPFDGRICRDTCPSTATGLSYTTADLTDVPSHIKAGLDGTFVAWTRLLLPGSGPPPTLDAWIPAVVTIASAQDGSPTVAASRTVRVHIRAEPHVVPFHQGARLAVLLMMHLHAAPQQTMAADDLGAQYARDVSHALALLRGQAWDPREALERGTLGGRLGDAAGRVRRTVDEMPLHRVGVRSEAALARDMLIGRGGLWVRR